MNIFKTQFRDRLTDYITALAWSIDPQTLVIASASGEVKLWQGGDTLVTLQGITGKSIDSLGISADGRYLATGGQDGKVNIWHLPDRQLSHILDNNSAWIDKLSWHPQYNLLAFGVDRHIHIWDAEAKTVIAKLNFADSSAFALDWHPQAKLLAVAGYRGIKIWQGDNWEKEPTILDIPTASVAVAWSKNGKFIAYGNMNDTLVINEWGNSDPWIMQGFPGKVRTLTWSQLERDSGAPLIAASSIEGIVVWEKQIEDDSDWDAWVLEGHLEKVNAIAFQPNSFNLASAANDGHVCLWQDAENLIQIIDGAKEGFSSLAWHPDGKLLAAGGTCGEVLIWCQALIPT